MGVLEDVGVIKDGKVSDSAFRKYIEDVKKMLESGQGIFPPGVTCNMDVKPTPGANLLQLEDQELFPDFHRIWRPRYENMVLSLDVPGDFQLAKNGLLPLIDPTAVATTLGLKPPPLDLPGALTAMLSGPPMGTQPFIVAYFNDIAVNPSKILEFLKPGSDFMKIMIPSLSIPPLPNIPNPLLLKFGYTEQFNFELALGLAPVKTQLKLMVPALFIDKMPGIIAKLAQGDVLGGLVKFVCDIVAEDQPKSMSTSSLEIAAQQVLQQHQVKYQALTFVGQQIGSGVVTKGLATTSFDSGGLEIIKDEVPEDHPVFDIVPNSYIRMQIADIIRNILPPIKIGDGIAYPSDAFKAVAPSYHVTQIKSGAKKKVKKKVTDPKTKKTTEVEVEEDVLLGAKDSIEYYQLMKKTNPDAAAQLAEKVKADGGDTKGLEQNINYTTCGDWARYVYSALYDKLGFDLKNRKKYSVATAYQGGKAHVAIGPKGGTLSSVALAGGGLSSAFIIGRCIENELGLPLCTVWVNADLHTGGEAAVDVIKNRYPRLGDAILDMSTEKIGSSIAQLPGRYVEHVSIFHERRFEGGVEYWITSDGGQGSRENQAVLWCKKRIDRDPNYGILLNRNKSDLSGHRSRIIGGWLDIDGVPELNEPPVKKKK